MKRMALVTAVLFLLLSQTAWACGSAPDPHYDPSGYSSWCRCVGGTTYTGSYGGLACRPGSGGGSTPQGSGSSSYGGYNPNMSPNQMMLQTMQNLMNNFSQGVQRGIEQNRQRAIQQQQENQRRQRALQAQRRERERQAKEEEKRHRQQFQEAKARMLGQMRGGGSQDIQPRNLSSLEVRETRGAFGITTLKPRDLSRSTQLASAAHDSHAWLRKANCSNYLLDKALGNLKQGHFEEAAYLSNEASALASGAKSSSAVVCPSLPDVPDVKGAQTPEDKARAAAFIKHTMLVSKIFTKAARQMKDYKAIQQTGRQAQQKVDEAKIRLEEAKARKEKLEQQQEADAKKASMMAAALAALQKSKEALALSEKHLAKVRKEQENMKKGMKQTLDMFNAAQKNPDKADKLLEQLSQTKEDT